MSTSKKKSSHRDSDLDEEFYKKYKKSSKSKRNKNTKRYEEEDSRKSEEKKGPSRHRASEYFSDIEDNENQEHISSQRKYLQRDTEDSYKSSKSKDEKMKRTSENINDYSDESEKSHHRSYSKIRRRKHLENSSDDENKRNKGKRKEYSSERHSNYSSNDREKKSTDYNNRNLYDDDYDESDKQYHRYLSKTEKRKYPENSSDEDNARNKRKGNIDSERHKDYSSNANDKKYKDNDRLDRHRTNQQKIIDKESENNKFMPRVDPISDNDVESKHDEQETRRKKRNQKESSEMQNKEANDEDLETKEIEPLSKRQKIVNINMRTGGAYIPPARLRMMQNQIKDKGSEEYQRIAWEALKKSIVGMTNKVNSSNLAEIVPELFRENIIRGRGVLARAIMQAQAASPTFTRVYAALVAIINTKFPEIGELILKRLIIQYKRGFRRNDKTVCMTAARFLAHLLNQEVAHEILILEIVTHLLEKPTEDSIEVAIACLKECGKKLTQLTPRGMQGFNI